ncbi:TPA: HNH endonuclease [Vibrio parahaemolyticus]|nr:HNH endonuclease [Vibrio parahaemolyticus]HCE4677509.1 HNH endonuclease [Vibrio parahaemolyticus]
MRYWWVSQNATFKQESEGGYLWSPKTNSNGSRNHFYDNMTLVSVGDVVLSFESTRISAVGVVTKAAYSSPKPTEFGNVGDVWSDDGWKVELDYSFLDKRIRPAEHMDVLLPLLPSKYSPLQASGRGNQAYLFELPKPLFDQLVSLIGHDEVDSIINSKTYSAVLEEREDQIEEELLAGYSVGDTVVEQVIKSRKGQGIFRSRVEKIEPRCRVTGVDDRRHLVASHIKPWRDSTNEERLDGNNGLMLAPHIDHLFDKGFISFTDKGDILFSSAIDEGVLRNWGVGAENVGSFNPSQSSYLQFHRDNIFLD